ncbi:MAG: MCP four helix bundle domain-containing protein [Moritella sp.]|uniref:ATP-binding protein n=1 Tax=Moritella sp. TaxID=78556 RepID=UPI001D245AC9|nr:ATP-binding protein [Moritella sp.]NQZ50452.1 MCP four helix bundle domain-containing protein [Moritella sp.]
MIFKFTTIGSRLVAAFTCILLMIFLVSTVAFTTWNTLENQVDLMTEENIPALTLSYQIERSSAELRAHLNEIHTTPNLVRLNQLKLGLQHNIKEINQATIELSANPLVNNLQQEYHQLDANIQEYSEQLTQKLKLKHNLDKISETILWLHQDIIDEINPLRLEIEWQITHDRAITLNAATQTSLYTDFSTFQMLTINENELISLVQEVIRQHPQRNLNSEFQFIGYKTDELQTLSNALLHNAASITHRQLLLELINLVQPEGRLHTVLQQIATVNKQTNNQKVMIKTRLTYQQEQIKNLVTTASNELNGIKREAKQTVSMGNAVLLIVLLCALLSSTFICTYFVRKRIVGRLNDLSLALNAVVSGKVNLPISVTGEDEIGKLGTNLRNFCSQMQEIEKTNALNLINNTQASIITCTTEGVIESMNSRAKELFPLLSSSSSSVESEGIWNLFEYKEHQQLKLIFLPHSTLLRDGAYNLTLAMNHTHHQTRYFRLDLRVFQKNTHPKIIITLTDITEQENITRWLEQKVQEKTQSLTTTNTALQDEIEERKRAELNLVSTQDELIQAAKMAVVGQAMTTLAHELNQPLSALSTYIFTVQMTYNSSQYSEIHNTMEKMNEICERMDQIIANLRGFSKKPMTSNPAVTVALQRATDNAIGIVAYRAKQHNIQLNNHLDDNCLCIGELLQIEQVLVNLLINSCDALAPFVDKQGQIEIIELGRTDQFITLACCDNGPGFDCDIINKLFTPFTTSKEVGLGLGLSICRSIMTRLNGSIQLASTLDGGAMIILEFLVNETK